MCQKNHICIVYMFRYNHYTYLSACLNSKRFINALELVCNILQLLQTICICLQRLTSCTRSGC